MAAGVIRNFLIQAPTPAYFPLIFQHSPCKEDDDVEMLEETPEAREDEEEREVDEEEEEDEDEESEAQEEEEGCLEAFLNPAHYALDVTKQLLRFADLISRDVQRYFGRCSGDQEACDIYSDSVSVTTGGRLRYYDDLLKIARAGSPEKQDNRLVTGAEDQGVRVAKGNSSLGPLAELFNQRGQSQGRGRPMIKRILPLSFWSEPIPCCSLVSFSSTPDVTHTHTHTRSDTPSQDSTHADSDTHMHQSTHADSDTHAHQSTHTDSDTHAHHQSTHADSDTHAHHQSTHTDSDTHMHQSTHADSDTHAHHQSTHTDSDTHAHCNPLPHHSTHALDNTQLDFSDLLAYWDPNPELTHTLTENTHMQH